jgi:hypothetical protein
MPAVDRVAVIDLEEYRRRRRERTERAASSTSNGVQPMAWCYVWMMVPYGYPVGALSV